MAKITLHSLLNFKLGESNKYQNKILMFITSMKKFDLPSLKNLIFLALKVPMMQTEFDQKVSV